MFIVGGNENSGGVRRGGMMVDEYLPSGVPPLRTPRGLGWSSSL